MTTLKLPILYTADDGMARFLEANIALTEGSPMARLSSLQDSTGLQWRQSPVGFTSDFHCTTTPQWLVVLQGQMDIGLQDGSWRSFRAGECFYSGDTLPTGATFSPTLHGHRSRQVGHLPLITLFVRAGL